MSKLDPTHSVYILNQKTNLYLNLQNASDKTIGLEGPGVCSYYDLSKSLAMDRWMLEEASQAANKGYYRIISCLHPGICLAINSKGVVFGEKVDGSTAESLWKPVGLAAGKSHFNIVSHSNQYLTVANGKLSLTTTQTEANNVWILEYLGNVSLFNNMYALGPNGRLMCWAGDHWSALPFGRKKFISANFDHKGYLWGVASNGDVFQWQPPAFTKTGLPAPNGGTWTKKGPFADWRLISLAFDSNNNKYGVNASGKVGKWDKTGKKWVTLAEGTHNFTQVAVDNTGAVYAVTMKGDVLEWQSQKWNSTAVSGVYSITFDCNTPQQMVCVITDSHQIGFVDARSGSTYQMKYPTTVVPNTRVCYRVQQVFYSPSSVAGGGFIETLVCQPPLAFPTPGSDAEKDAYSAITSGYKNLAAFRKAYALSGKLPEIATTTAPKGVDAKIFAAALAQIKSELAAVETTQNLYSQLVTVLNDTASSFSTVLSSIEGYMQFTGSTDLTAAILTSVLTAAVYILGGVVTVALGPEASIFAGFAITTVTSLLSSGIAVGGAVATASSGGTDSTTLTIAKMQMDIVTNFNAQESRLQAIFNGFLQDWGKLKTIAAKFTKPLDLPAIKAAAVEAYELTAFQAILPTKVQFSAELNSPSSITEFQFDANDVKGNIPNFNGESDWISFVPTKPSADLINEIARISGGSAEDLFTNQFGWNLPYESRKDFRVSIRNNTPYALDYSIDNIFASGVNNTGSVPALQTLVCEVPINNMNPMLPLPPPSLMFPSFDITVTLSYSGKQMISINFQVSVIDGFKNVKTVANAPAVNATAFANMANPQGGGIFVVDLWGYPEFATKASIV